MPNLEGGGGTDENAKSAVEKRHSFIVAYLHIPVIWALAALRKKYIMTNQYSAALKCPFNEDISSLEASVVL